MSENNNDTAHIGKEKLEGMFAVGAHFGYQRTRRHPSVRPYLFGSKNRVDIIDLEKAHTLLESAKAFVKGLGREGRQLLFVGTKPEAREIVLASAKALGLPYVTNRWIGGTLTNFPEIKKRIDRYLDLAKRKEEGALNVYTKKERLLLDREMEELEKNFGGLLAIKRVPDALFIVDSRHEEIALTEANKVGLPVISLSNSDCDVSGIAHPVIANDSAVPSIAFFVKEIEGAYEAGQREGALEVKEEPKDEAKAA